MSSLHCKKCTTISPATVGSSLLPSAKLQSNFEQLLSSCSTNNSGAHSQRSNSRHSNSHCDSNNSCSSPTSAESKSSISAHHNHQQHHHHHSKPPPPLNATSHRSSRSSVNFQGHHHNPVSVRSSASTSSDPHQPYQPKHRISSSASSLTSPTLSSSSSSSPPSSPSSPFSSSQPVPSASSTSDHHHHKPHLAANSLSSAVNESERVKQDEEDGGVNQETDSTSIAYYGELTLMSVHPHSAQVNQLSSADASASAVNSSSNSPETVAATTPTPANLIEETPALANPTTVPASTNRQSCSSDVSSSSQLSGHSSTTTATKNLYSLQGDHFSGVNVTVEYVAAAERQQASQFDELKGKEERSAVF